MKQSLLPAQAPKKRKRGFRFFDLLIIPAYAEIINNQNVQQMFNICFAEDRTLQFFRRGSLRLGPVHVEGRSYRRVANLVLDILRTFAIVDQHRREKMLSVAKSLLPWGFVRLESKNYRKE